MKSKLIAISAISASLLAIVLTLGAYIELADVFMLTISSVFVILPLYYNSLKGSILTYLVGGIIAFLFSGFNVMSIVLPSYFAFFGLYPIIFWIMKSKNVKKIFKIIIGVIWSAIFIYGIFYYYTLVMQVPIGAFPAWAEWIVNYIEIVLGVLSVIFFFIYDKYVEVLIKVSNYYLRKIVK